MQTHIHRYFIRTGMGRVSKKYIYFIKPSFHTVFGNNPYSFFTLIACQATRLKPALIIHFFHHFDFALFSPPAHATVVAFLRPFLLATPPPPPPHVCHCPSFFLGAQVFFHLHSVSISLTLSLTTDYNLN